MSLFGEPDKPSLEERRFAQETASQERELNLKEREVRAKEEELKRSRWINPTVLGLFAAALSLLGSMILARINNSNTQEVQRLQGEANITLEAIKTGTGNTDAACKNLIFFVSLGLIRDPFGKIETTCKGVPTGPPSLPAGQTSSPIPSFLFKGKVVDSSTLAGIAGALVTIKTRDVPTGVEAAGDTVSGKDGLFFLQLANFREASTVIVNVTSYGYSETEVQVPANQNATIKLHKAP